MPSPLGHSLAGLLLARSTPVVIDRSAVLSRWASATIDYLGPGGVTAIALMTAANAPDLDFIPGLIVGTPDLFHRGLSHTLAAAGMFGVLAGLVARLAGLRRPGGVGLLLALAYATHLPLDMTASDATLGNGVKLFWPVSDERFVLPFRMFLDINRDASVGAFLPSLLSSHNALAMLVELVVLGPLVAFTGAWRPGRGCATPNVTVEHNTVD